MPTPRSSTKRERVPLIFSPSMLCWSQGGMSEWQLSDCNGTVKYMQYRYIIYICRYIPTSLFVKRHGNYFKYKYVLHMLQKMQLVSSFLQVFLQHVCGFQQRRTIWQNMCVQQLKKENPLTFERNAWESFVEKPFAKDMRGFCTSQEKNSAIMPLPLVFLDATPLKREWFNSFKFSDLNQKKQTGFCRFGASVSIFIFMC